LLFFHSPKDLHPSTHLQRLHETNLLTFSLHSTGRAGQDGKSVTFFTDHEKGLAGALINVLKSANQKVPEDLMKFGTTVKKKTHDAYGAFYKEDTGKKATKITFD